MVVFSIFDSWLFQLWLVVPSLLLPSLNDYYFLLGIQKKLMRLASPISLDSRITPEPYFYENLYTTQQNKEIRTSDQMFIFFK
jgi:hypothetical protein